MHQPNSGIELRQSIRLDMEKELIELSWTTKDGTHISRNAMCIDVSNGGLKVNIDRPIELDTHVKVVFKDKLGGSNIMYAKVIRETLVHDWFDVAMIFLDQGDAV